VYLFHTDNFISTVMFFQVGTLRESGLKPNLVEKAEGELKVARLEGQTADSVYIDAAFGET